jgi:hypothetical protein
MKVKEPDFAAAISLVWGRAPALLVPSFRQPPARQRRLQLQACDDVLPSGALDTRWWLTLAALVAIQQSWLSITRR